jgi:UDP-N-acetylglucosamine 2-epimerase
LSWQRRNFARKLRDFVKERPAARLVDSLGTQVYFSLMACAAVMVGNSSSGLVEAPSFELPVVNIGTRQAGRVRGKNVIDVGYSRAAIAGAIAKAVSPAFRASLKGIPNPYGAGKAARIITARLKEIEPNNRLLFKKFWAIAGSHGVPGCG